MIPFFGGEIPVEDDGKNGEIIVDPLVDFLGGISNFSLSFLIYSRIWNKKEKLDRSIGSNNVDIFPSFS